METLSSIIGFLVVSGLILGILQIILFFKIWIMTNDIRKISELLQCALNIREHEFRAKQQQSSSNIAEHNHKIMSNDIALYSWVRLIKTQKEFQVMEIRSDDTFLGVNSEYPDGVLLNIADIEIINNE